jgi:exopolysaccharide production protein ExoQ
LSERPVSPSAGVPGETAAVAPLAGANVMAVAAVIAPPLALFAALGEAGLLTVLALALVALDRRGSLAACRGLAGPAALLAALGAWAAVSTLWSVAPGHSFFEATRFLALSAAGLVVFAEARALHPFGRRRVGTALLIGTGLAVALLQLELWDGQALGRWLHGVTDGRFFLTSYDRGLVLLALIAWPAMAISSERFGLWAAALAALLMLHTLFAFYSHAAMVAMVAGLGAALIAWRAPRLVAAMMIVGMVAVAFVLPAVLPDGPTIQHWSALAPMKASGPHRLAIWHFVAERMNERPLLGWGMDASRAIPGGTALVQEVMPALPLGPTAQILPLHPHNAALQWRLELGVPGTVLALALVVLVLWRGARSNAPVIAMGFAGAALTIAVLSFGAWQAWWLSSLWLVAAFIAATATAPTEDQRRRGGAA